MLWLTRSKSIFPNDTKMLRIKNSNLKGIVFDLDGTLMNSIVCFHSVINTLLNDHNHPSITLDKLQPHADKGSRLVIAEFFQLDPQSDSVKKLQESFYQLWLERMVVSTPFYPGAQELLETLTHAKTPWGIVSNRPARFAQPLIQHHRIFDYAHCLVWGDTYSMNKPHPIQLKKACEMLGTESQHTLYVGDTENDMLAAHRNQMPFALAEYGYLRAESNIETLKADYRLQSIKQIIP